MSCHCQDILIDRALSFRLINLGIAHVFSISSLEVLVVKDLTKTIVISKYIRVLCQAIEIEGNFKQMISIYLKDESLYKITVKETLDRFCKYCKCIGLISDDYSQQKYNPNAMILLRGDNSYSTVFLCDRNLDEEKYVLTEQTID